MSSAYAEEHATNPCARCAAPPGQRCEHDDVELLDKAAAAKTKLHQKAEQLATMLTNPDAHPRYLNQAEQRMLARAYLDLTKQPP